MSGKRIAKEELRLMGVVLVLRDGLRAAIEETNKQRESANPELGSLHDLLWNLADRARLALKKG